MPNKKRQSWLRSITTHWEEEGTLPPTESGQQEYLQDAPTRQVYQTLLSLERMMQETETDKSPKSVETFEERSLEAQQEPSTHELKRGAQFVLQQILEAETESIAETEPIADTFEMTEIQEDSEESTITLTVTQPSIQEPTTNDHLSEPILTKPSQTWSQWLSLGTGICSLLLFVALSNQPFTLHPTKPKQNTNPKTRTVSLPPYAGSKGNGMVQKERQLRLMFGLSDATATQPQQRGKRGMKVRPGQWLYFLFMKPKIAGFLYLFRRNHQGKMKLLYPTAGKHVKVKADLRQWVLAHQGVALRYRIPHKEGRLGFVGVFAPKPLSKRVLQRTERTTLRKLGRKALIEQTANQLGLSSQQIDAFLIEQGQEK